jgi:hypothetical protein
VLCAFSTVTFHRRNPGGLKLEALLGLAPLHRARDLLREWIRQTGRAPSAAEYLELTYTTTGAGKRRYDSLSATPEFKLRDFATFYEEARAAGSDHAMIVAELAL